jgi:hypothetical protein
VIETAVEITRGEVRSHEFSKVPATSPRGIGKNTDAAALLKEGRTRPTRDFMCKALRRDSLGNRTIYLLRDRFGTNARNLRGLSTMM